MPSNTGKALLVLAASAIIFIYVLLALHSGKARAKGINYLRHDSPIGFWITVSIQAGLALFLFLYAFKLMFLL